MPDKRWKAVERRVARLVGGSRIPVTGERAGADVVAPLFAYQVKSRRSIPRWIFDWVQGIRGAARRDQVGALILHRPGDELREALVVVTLADWVALHGQDGLPARQDAPGTTNGPALDYEEG